MTLLTQKLSKLFFAKAICVVMLALFVIVFGASATLAQTKKASTVTAANAQVSFTVTATAVITGVTKLPGGLTQVNFGTSGNATHLGNFTGPLTRIQDNQGNFGSTAVIVGANGTDSVFFSVSGHFEGKGGTDKCVVTSTGVYTITGGAGAFANATGSGTIATQFDLCAGTTSGTYTGTISQPNSN
ncbi:MAG TPA: hypothetical protein VHP99_05010 [Pyrinomonadaceae bacterium]|jgi:hypothetical protein|nr:hypothetical protein [Pyrinomonadaceae bacterium]